MQQPTICLALLVMMCLPLGRWQEVSFEQQKAHRCRSEQAVKCPREGQTNAPPDVRLETSEEKVVVSCFDNKSSDDCPPGEGQRIGLKAVAEDADGDTMKYTYSTTGGRIEGEGAEVKWDVGGVRPGKYTATVEADDGCGCVAFATAQVTVEECAGCK